ESARSESHPMTDRDKPGNGAVPTPSEPPASDPPQARISAVLLETVKTVWDRLGLVLAASLTWSLIVSLPISLERALPRGAPQTAHLLVLALIPVLAALP